MGQDARTAANDRPGARGLHARLASVPGSQDHFQHSHSEQSVASEFGFRALGNESSDHRSIWLTFTSHAFVWSIGCMCLWLAWTGFVGSDDSYYVDAARGWLHAFPYVANNFGEARLVVALPIAAMFVLFGDHEFTAVLSSCLFLLGTASLTLVMLRPYIGLCDSTLASAALVTVPLFALKSTTPSADLPELFFAVLSLWFFQTAGKAPRHWIPSLMLAGAAAALAFLAHETSAALLVFYGLLFLIGVGPPRLHYWFMAAGFAVVVASECAYYWIAAGDPLYRISMLLHQMTLPGDRTHVGFLQVAAGGTLHIWGPLDPVLMFFTKQEFALLGVIAVPALFWAMRRVPDPAPAAHRFARYIGALGIVWFVFAAILLDKLILLPRYYMAPAYCFYVVAVIWVAISLKRRRPWAALALLGIFVMTNFLAVEIDNKDPRFGERALAEYLQSSKGSIYTDPYTAYYVENYAIWDHVDYKRVSAGFPTVGYSYFSNPNNANRPNRFVPANEVEQYAAPRDWPIIWRKEAPPKFIGVVLEKLNVLGLLPTSIARKLLSPNYAVAVYKTTTTHQP